MNVYAMQWGWSQAAWGLLGIVALILLSFYLESYRRKILRNYFLTPSLANGLFRKPSLLLRSLKLLFLCLAWLFAIFALMQPLMPEMPDINKDENLLSQKTPSEDPTSFVLKRKAQEVIFILDTSLSMTVADTRLGINRLSYGKEIAQDILKDLKGENVSLFELGGSRPTVPRTLDYLYLYLKLDELEEQGAQATGTDFEGMLKTLKDYSENRFPNEVKTVILLTDGGDTSFEGLSPAQQSTREKNILKILEGFKNSTVRFAVIGLGTPAGRIIPHVKYQNNDVLSKREDSFLEALAEKGKGIYIDSNLETPTHITSEVIEWMSKQATPLQNSEKKGLLIGDSSSLNYILWFQIPLAFAIIFLISSLMMTEVRR